MSLQRQYIWFKIGESVMMCTLTGKLENQIRVPGSTKKGNVTFVKNRASSFTKIRSQQIFNVKGSFLSFETYRSFSYSDTLLYFYIYLHQIYFELTFFPFQQSRHYLLVCSWGKQKSRGFCYTFLFTHLRHKILTAKAWNM